MMSRTALAWAIAVWMLVAWGGRVLIVFDAGSAPWDRARIALSVVTAVFAVLALWRDRWVKFALVSYATVAAVVWTRSVFTVATGVEGGAFKRVHFILAAVSLGLALWALVTVRRVR